MTITQLLKWLRKNNAQVGLGFKKDVPYVKVKVGAIKLKFGTGTETISAVEQSLCALIESGVNAIDTTPMTPLDG